MKVLVGLFGSLAASAEAWQDVLDCARGKDGAPDADEAMLRVWEEAHAGKLSAPEWHCWVAPKPEAWGRGAKFYSYNRVTIVVGDDERVRFWFNRDSRRAARHLAVAAFGLGLMDIEYFVDVIDRTRQIMQRERVALRLYESLVDCWDLQKSEAPILPPCRSPEEGLKSLEEYFGAEEEEALADERLPMPGEEDKYAQYDVRDDD
jgi:hypothetical protein